jgi:hypothetical protein
MLQGLSNDQINYGMKHFLSKMDVDKITNGEHPQFSALNKLDILIRGALNKKLAENMKYTASVNERLMLHYRNYPNSPAGFPHWEKLLKNILQETFTRFS